MPVITLEISELSKQTKKELEQELTQTASKLTRIPEEKFIVIIHEQPDENIAVGGVPLNEIKQQGH